MPEELAAITDILVPLDFSDCSLNAFEFAKRLAAPLDARLHLLHVNDDPMLIASTTDPSFREEHDREAIGRMSALIPDPANAGFKIENVIRFGTAYFEIEKYAEEGGIDLIVIGNVGHSKLSRALLGSVTSHVISHAVCPVVSVKRH